MRTMTTDRPYLSIIIPQYNELSNLKKGLLRKSFSYLKTVRFTYEVIVIDDGSTDGSLNYIEDNYAHFPFLKIVKAKHGGKPNAIFEGVKNTLGEYTLFTDMDQSTPLEELDKLLPFIQQYRAVIGSRGGKRISATLTRKVAGRIFSSFRKVFILRNIDDTQCGFKLFESSLLKETFPQLNALKSKNVKGWSVSAFDVELLYLIGRQGHKIKEVQVQWRDQDISDTKNRKFFQESLDMVKQVLMVVYREVSGEYRRE